MRRGHCTCNHNVHVCVGFFLSSVVNQKSSCDLVSCDLQIIESFWLKINDYYSYMYNILSNGPITLYMYAHAL